MGRRKDGKGSRGEGKGERERERVRKRGFARRMLENAAPKV
jgi:hypothetical protein